MKSINETLQVITPVSQDAIGSSAAELCRWISANRSALEARLQGAGALLFRGFTIEEPEEFEQVISAIGQVGGQDGRQASRMLNYVGGTTPREKVSGQVYTSTSAPRFLKIPLHSEMSYLRKYPGKILFHCRVPSKRGGETPIADTRKIYRALSPEVRSRFEEKGVCYVRHLVSRTRFNQWLSRVFPIAGLQTWQTVFKTESREEVDQFCAAQFSSHEWLPDGSLLIRNQMPAVRQHPVTGENVWFNQAYFSQLHRRVSGRWLTPLLKAYHRLTGKPYTNATYGDGSPISSRDLEVVMDAIDRNTFAFPWHRGDVLALDNLLMAHGRNPFKGRRQILVGMLE